MMAASAGASAIWKTIRPHIPLIKFRKGGSSAQELVRGAPPLVSMLEGSLDPRGPAPAPTGGVLEEWQVPLRFQRPILTEEEIDCINSGGVRS